MQSAIAMMIIQSILFGVLISSALAHEFTGKEKSWWAVQPVREVVVPDKEGHPVDGFVRRKLSEQNLKMAPVASAEEFVRRAYFDLIGLPPTVAQLEEFRKAWEEDQEKAVKELVDELLASPRYGERWATHWLDVVRYADSDGYRADDFRGSAYLYRDYVVRAFNEDKPYDEFLKEQLAADEITPNEPERVAATGFLRHGVYEWNQRNAEMQREIMINEITAVTGEVFLGLGVGCAQCHDHKFDPILQKDYFALQAFLSSTTWPDDRYHATNEEVAEYEEKLETWEEATGEIRAEIKSLLGKKQQAKYDFRVKTFPPEVQEMFAKPEAEKTAYEKQISLLVHRQAEREVRDMGKPEKVLEKDSPERLRYDELKVELASFDYLKPKAPTRAFVATDTGADPAVVTIPGKKDAVIEPQFLELLGGEVPKIRVRAKTTGRRTALAEWMVRKDNPLTARVMVNRIWQHHFGKGLTASPNDFGMLGEAPSHPGLLDWLARNFLEGGWKMKRMHRLMMTSQAYRQTARYEPSEAESLKDPGNRLLWRYPPKRLSAEQVRDAMLAVSGELKHRDGGAAQGNETPVRSVYLRKMRNTPDAVLQCFDAPLGFASEPNRLNTTTATQSLLLANSEWPLTRARAMAKRLLKGGMATKMEVVEAYRNAWGREPSEKEIEGAMLFLKEQVKKIEGGKTEKQMAEKSSLVALKDAFDGAEDFLPEGSKSALKLVPGSKKDRLRLDEVKLTDDHFTVSAVVNLEKIHPDGRVNTVVSQWDGNQKSPGWSIGVTSAKSRYDPRNFIVQLIGRNPGGDVEYEVVASELRVPLGVPVFLAVAVDPQPQGQGTVRFFMKDLSKEETKMETALVAHNIAGTVRTEKVPVLVGGRSDGSLHGFAGQVARVTITPKVLGDLEREPGEAVLDLVFNDPVDGVPFAGTSWMGSGAKKTVTSSEGEAFADFCHALLSSNEFLYLH